MKRMVKNGDLIDVEPDGSITVAGKPIGGGGGSDYTAGKNINISEAKEISLPNDLTLLKSISIFGNNESGKVVIKQTANGNLFFMTENFPSFRLFGGSGYSSKDLNIYFDVESFKNYTLRFDFTDLKEGSLYTLISRARVPDAPSGDGTYILKATVSNGNLTYSWVAE